MLRRRITCAGLPTAATSPNGNAACPTVLATARRGGIFDGFNDILKKNMPSAAGGGSNGSNNSNTQSSSNGAFPAGLDLQKLKTMQDMFNSQPPEKQEQLMKQALEMQKMMSKMPGFKKMSQMNTQVLEELMKQKHQQPSQGQGAVSSSNSTGNTSSGSTGKASGFPSHPFAGTQTPRASTSSGSGSGAAPTLDDLKKINLGPEIEALFAELRAIRKRKNEYRDKYHTEKVRADSSESSRAALETSENSLRAKLKKAEQEVMLLTSENMEVRDGAKQVKQLSADNAKLKKELRTMKEALQASTAAGSPQYHDMQLALQNKDEALRSLGRKVERMRRRDPLLHFSLCCNDVTRLCELKVGSSVIDASSSSSSSASALSSMSSAAVKDIAQHMNRSSEYLNDELAKEFAEEKFGELQAAYVGIQQQAWRLAATGGSAADLTSAISAGVKPHAAATAYAAFVRRLFLSKIPFANYDAVVTVRVDKAGGSGAEALQQLLRTVGGGTGGLSYSLERLSESAGDGTMEERYIISAPATATTRDMLLTPGPFAVAFALRAVTEKLNHASTPGGCEVLTAGNPTLAAALSSFSITHAQPYVSDTLLRNSNRVAVLYESARASGPGGQAVNVAETQIKAKLMIDQQVGISPSSLAQSNSITVGGVTLRVVSAGDAAGEGSGSHASGSGAAAASGASSGMEGIGGASGGTFAYMAESQDSRSALQNKTSATEKLLTTERRRYNEGTLRSPFGRCDEVEGVLKRCWLAETGGATLETDVVQWCVEASANSTTVRASDAVLVLAFKRFVEEAKA